MAPSTRKPKGFPHKANPKLQEEFMAEYEKLKDEVGIEAVHLILDRSGYHRSMLLAEKVIELNIKHQNLNFIERLWEKMRNNRFFKNAKDFKEALNQFFDDILLKSNDRINDNFELLKT